MKIMMGNINHQRDAERPLSTDRQPSFLSTFWHDKFRPGGSLSPRPVSFMINFTRRKTNATKNKRRNNGGMFGLND
jgi:hypothetical protein